MLSSSSLSGGASKNIKFESSKVNKLSSSEVKKQTSHLHNFNGSGGVTKQKHKVKQHLNKRIDAIKKLKDSMNLSPTASSRDNMITTSLCCSPNEAKDKMEDNIPIQQVCTT